MNIIIITAAPAFFRNHALKVSIIFVCLSGFLLLNPLQAETPQDIPEVKDLGFLEKIVRKNLGRDVAFKFRPRMLGMTGLNLENFRIAENKEYLANHTYLSPIAFSAEHMHVHYNPFAFFIGRISLKEVKIENPQVQISIDRHFNNNFQDIMDKQKKNRFSNWIRAHHIQIENMNWNIFSELLFSQPITYEVLDIDVNINNVIKNKIATVDIKAKTPGAAEQNVSIDGTIGPIVSIGLIEESPMNLQVYVKDAPLDFKLARIPENVLKDKRYGRTVALPESGLANMHYDIQGDVWEQLTVLGKITMNDIVFASLDKSIKGKPFNVTVDSQVTSSLNKQLATLDQVSIAINESKMTLEGKVEQFKDNPKADIRLYSNTFNLRDFNEIYPFVSDRYKIKFIQGTTDLNVTTTGNLKDGIFINGQFNTKNLQLANLDESRKGATLDSSLSLTKPIEFYSKKNQVIFDQIDLKVANSTVSMAGVIDDATLVDRTLKAKMYSKDLDISAMHQFIPFFDKYLPDDLKYSGFFTFDMNMEGSILNGSLKGNADFSKMNFSIQNFIRKTKESSFNVEYFASYKDQEPFTGGASFVLEQGELNNSVIFVGAIRHLLGGDKMSSEARAYYNSLDPDSIYFEKSTGNFSITDLDSVQVDLKLSGIQSLKHKNAELTLKGDIGTESYDLSLKGELRLNPSSYEELIKLQPSASKYLNKDKSSLRLPIGVTGTINQPQLKLIN